MKSNVTSVKEGYELLINNEKIKKAGRSLTLRLVLVLAVFLVVLVSGLLSYLFIYILQKNNVFSGIAVSPTTDVLVGLLFFIVSTTGLTYIMWPIIFRPLDKVIHSMDKASQGDFSGEVPLKGCHGDVRTLVESYNNMLSELSGIEIFREDFVRNFSHELKTPIVSIRGFAQQLLRTDLTEAQKREYTEMIVSESEKLTNMSASVLLLSKLESTELVGGRTLFSLDEQLRECLLRYQQQWESKNLELDIELEPVKYFGSPKMLEHIWTNLISNAIKFTEPGGTIGIGCEKREGAVSVFVSDTGCGMDENTIKHIFEKFYQGDTAHAAAGNGLGLSIVKRVAELNGGQIALKSVPGTGSVFTVTLPVTERKHETE